MPEKFQEQLTILRELQEIDLNLHKCRVLLDGLPKRLQQTESALAAVTEELSGTKAELKELEHTRRTDEADLAASVEHLREREAKLYAIKTNKEYQAALKEISEAKRQNREREDRILAAMERIEELTQKSTQLETDFADKEKAYKAKKEEVDAEERTLRQTVEEGEAKRPDLVSRLEKVIQRKYDFIRQRYPDALVPVVNVICQGCSRRIPPQLYNEMLRQKELKVCPNCQRMIYVMEASPEEAGG
jgi:predicted  nucleic acid-binding Zn-ribbon protein